MAKDYDEIDAKVLFTESEMSIEDVIELKDKVIGSIVVRRQFEKTLTAFLEGKSSKLSEDTMNARQGIAYWIINQIDKAISLLESAHSSRLVNYFLGLCYLEKNKTDLAYELLKKIYQDNTDKMSAIIPLLQVLVKRNETEEALNIIEKAKKAHKNEADLYYYTGVCLDYMGLYEKADEEYKHAIRLKSDHPATIFRQAYMADLSGDDDRALSLYEKLRFHKPPFINALVNLGLTYEDKGENDKAIDCYSMILDYYPLHDRARMYLKDAKATTSMFYDEELKRREKYWHNVMQVPISDFPMSTRSRAVLEEMGITSLGDLTSKTEEELLKRDNFGLTSLNELKEIMSRKGLNFKQLGSSGDTALRLLPIDDSSKKQDVLNKSIFDMDWSTRIRSCLAKLKVYTLRDLTIKTERDLLTSSNFGQISLREIKQRLAEIGLSLKQESLS
jgi:DNA-directed RNA polymerase subunit alpha